MMKVAQKKERVERTKEKGNQRLGLRKRHHRLARDNRVRKGERPLYAGFDLSRGKSEQPQGKRGTKKASCIHQQKRKSFRANSCKRKKTSIEVNDVTGKDYRTKGGGPETTAGGSDGEGKGKKKGGTFTRKRKF